MLAYTLLGALLSLMTALPLAWKWQLGVHRVAIFVVVAATLSGLFVAFVSNFLAINPLLRPGLVWLLTISIALAMLAYRFYRDPERSVPDRTDVIVSPADGEVIYVRTSHAGTLPVTTKHGKHYTLHDLTRTSLHTEEAIVIGIGMNFLDVHVNRAPIAGQVTLRRHFAGLFGSLRLPEMVFENERATTVIARDDLEVAVVQIASRLVRQIASFVREGQQVALAQRIGVIRLGSQVDLVLPVREDLQVMVKPGQRVSAGESVLAVMDAINRQPARNRSHQRTPIPV